MSLDAKQLLQACKRRPILPVCCLLSLVLLVTLYFIKDKPAELQAELEQKEKVLTQLTNNIKFAVGLDSHLSDLTRANAALQAAALIPTELALNQQFFYELEATTGVKLLDLGQQPIGAPPKGAAPSPYVRLIFGLTAQGEYPQLMLFLRYLENSPTLCRITTASIGQVISGPQTINLSVELLGIRK
jgi:hypothetical protein